jgi:hypothetical protein
VDLAAFSFRFPINECRRGEGVGLFINWCTSVLQEIHGSSNGSQKRGATKVSPINVLEHHIGNLMTPLLIRDHFPV